MMQRAAFLAPLALAMIGAGCASNPARERTSPIAIAPGDALPAIPGIGLAAGYGGTVGGALIFAGGTNFPDAPPWRNGKKVWHDAVYRLAPGEAAWRVVGKLPRPRAGGATVETPGGLLCIGGTDDANALADAFRLRVTGDRVAIDPLPPLPEPRTACAAARVGRRVYVVAGHAAHTPLVADPSAAMWSIDPDDPAAGWRAEPPLPGPGRWAPVVASDGERLIVLSGMVRKPPDAVGGAFGIGFLRDVWAFDTRAGAWTRLADLPRSVAAAPSPAPVVGGTIVLLGGGVDAADIVKPMDQRDPLDAEVRLYDLATGATTLAGARLAPGVVVAPVATRRGQAVVISGEVQAGVRTGSVQTFQIR